MGDQKRIRGAKSACHVYSEIVKFGLILTHLKLFGSKLEGGGGKYLRKMLHAPNPQLIMFSTIWHNTFDTMCKIILTSGNIRQVKDWWCLFLLSLKHVEHLTFVIIQTFYLQNQPKVNLYTYLNTQRTSCVCIRRTLKVFLFIFVFWENACFVCNSMRKGQLRVLLPLFWSIQRIITKKRT